MYILGLSAHMHDTSACLLQDGHIIAAVEEERFTRQRHAWRQIPHHASRYCLDVAGIELEDVDYVVTSWNTQSERAQALTPQEMEAYRVQEFYRYFPPHLFPCKKFPALAYINHHLAHAASAFRCSGLDEATILVIDGRGENVSTSIYLGKDNQIRLLREFDITNSLGFFYLSITRFIGFGGWGEGKTMGYAPYGIPRYDFDYIRPTRDGYCIDWDRPVPHSDREAASGDCTIEIMAEWVRRLEQQFGEPNLHPSSLDMMVGRIHNQRSDEQIYRDIAASAQKKLEEIGLHLAQLAVAETQCRNLVLAGGVALNCVMNGALITSNIAEHIFIQPASQDAGTSIGAALELYAQLGYHSSEPMLHTSLGPAYKDQTIKSVLDHVGIPYTECNDPAFTAAQLLTDNEVIGWFQGGLEFGPRALGNRSILANPATTGMHTHLNTHVKHREAFRPYGLSLSLEKASDLFEFWYPSPFMLLNFTVKADQQSKVREGLHIDGTTRPQIVDQASQPLYWRLLNQFAQLTGIPAVINTSLNDYGAPLVCTPYDALRTFFSTSMDSMIMGNFLIQKQHVRK